MEYTLTALISATEQDTTPTRYWPNVVLMLDQRMRRWSTLNQHLLSVPCWLRKLSLSICVEVNCFQTPTVIISSPDNIQPLVVRWPNVRSWVGPTLASNVGPTTFCSLATGWPTRVYQPLVTTLGRRLSNLSLQPSIPTLGKRRPNSVT